MSETGEQGYTAGWADLRRESSVMREARDGAAAVRDALRAALDRDRAALGDDQYGAELSRRLPGIEQGIFDAFDAYLGELDGTGAGLGMNAINYETAERYNQVGE
ncbi:hypothetical protein Misp01_32460 [Microtetraspora sp. NBRC 13810]|uniref:hypothetical protein n=1 Tax=Microtetraspora sp. NBRC 13810 TaxID=3030990 RepID=UPI0024A5BE8B|nr:hypothetical protein [Microtetraspora sp. NBRC 13810]GLW08116.1 hypothetical protein Misp01_32460 [Microtetraspora sp. NBRC 13810]